ncbi:MAG: hypothetical protein ACOC3J_06265, partial [Gemmatimonadota bacterium]
EPMGEQKSLLSRIVTWTIIAVLAVLALKAAAWLLRFLIGIVGMVFGLAMFLLFTVGPILFLGWLAMKGWQAFTRKPAA